jgi:hypothetical protein
MTPLAEALRDALDEFDRNTCLHEETHRAGAQWTICNSCGMKWADDEGGPKPYVDPPKIAAARAVLAAELEGGDRYLIWSNEHRLWWRPNGCGYSRLLAEAGRYSHDEALRICRSARDGWRPGEPPPEIPVLEQDATHCARPLEIKGAAK